MRPYNRGLSDRDLERDGYALPSKHMRERALEMLRQYKGASVLLYLAGNMRSEYQKLPYDLVIVSNYDFNNKLPMLNGKVLQLPFENRLSMRLIIKAGLKVDCLVAINDGDFEGGNIGGCVNTEEGFSQIMPLLNDECLYVTDHFYGNDYFICGRGRYQRNPVKFFDVPYHTELLSENPFPIPLQTFSDNQASVFRLRRTERITASGMIGNVMLSVHNDSIWSHRKHLDGLFVPEMHPLVFRNYCQAKKGAYHSTIAYINDHGRDINIRKMIRYAEQQGWEQIGMVPFGKGRYGDFLKLLERYNGSVQEINLYHLNAVDLSEIYSALANMQKNGAAQ